MPTYNIPGVYIEEIPTFPPSIAAVATAIPVFIGFTEKAIDENGESIPVNTPKRITSLLEYERCFGNAQVKEFSVDVTESGSDITVAFATTPGLPTFFMYYSLQLFYTNGGGPCYIVSIGDYGDTPTQSNFTDVFVALESVDEITLVVFPDACHATLTDANYRAIVDAALQHCNTTQDRFVICDIRNAVPGGTDINAEVTTNFRGITSDLDRVKYGAAYFPYLRTSLPFRTNDLNIEIDSHTVDGGSGPITANATLDSIKADHTAVYNAVQQFIGANGQVTIPPSGGVAGVYARVDSSRGVWKAPANVSLSNVIAPAIMGTNDLYGALNIDATSGKSVNAIRSFVGKGTLVWGARTLAGNDNENKYISVRRFLNFAEESIQKAIDTFVFEPNDANTWVKVKAMIENFLTNQWRDGALAGAKPEDAFGVFVGLNKTMTAQDILDGRMIVEIRLAIVRPAEFIILRFSQLMQQS